MKTQVLGFFTPWIIYAIITLLHLILPAKQMDGYVKNDKTGKVLSYRLNRFAVLIVSLMLWILLGYLGWVPYDWLYTVRWASLIGAISIGVIFSLIIVLTQPSTGKSLLADLFLGRLKNPQTPKGRIDAKMWLKLIGFGHAAIERLELCGTSLPICRMH